MELEEPDMVEVVTEEVEEVDNSRSDECFCTRDSPHYLV